MAFCEEHTTLVKDVSEIKGIVTSLDKRINGSFDAISDHVNGGHRWRIAIVSIALTLCLNLVGFAYGYGILKKTVDTNAYAITEMKENNADVKEIKELLKARLK